MPRGPAFQCIPAARSLARTIVHPLLLAQPASVNRAPLTAGLLSLPKNSKNGTMHAWPGPLRPLLGEGPERLWFGAAFCRCPLGWHFKETRGGVGAGREEGEEVQKTQRSCQQARAPPLDSPVGRHPGPQVRPVALAGSTRAQILPTILQLLRSCSSRRAVPSAPRSAVGPEAGSDSRGHPAEGAEQGRGTDPVLHPFSPGPGPLLPPEEPCPHLGVGTCSSGQLSCCIAACGATPESTAAAEGPHRRPPLLALAVSMAC